MRITELKLHNFMNVANAHLSFNEGLNVIGGANGMGKSVVFSAVAFFLTESKRGDSWKDFIKIGEKSMSIQMTLYKYEGDEPILFDYTGDASSGSMTKTISYRNEFHKNDACAEFLSKYFDMEMLENVVFHLQDSENVASLSPAKRRDLLKKIFNSDFTFIAEKVKEDITTIKAEIQRREAEIEALNKMIFSPIELEVIDSYQLQKQIDSVHYFRVWEGEIGVLRDLINSKKMVLAQAQQISSSLTPQMSLLTSQKNALSLSIQNLEKTIPLKKTEIEVMEKMNVSMLLEEDINQKNIVFDKQKLETDGTMVDELSTRMTEAQIKLSNATAQYNLLAKQVSVFSSSPTCPTCGQDCSEEHKHILEDQLKGLETLKVLVQQELTEKNTRYTEENTKYMNSYKAIEVKERDSISRNNNIKNNEVRISSLKAGLILLETSLQKDRQSLIEVEERYNDITVQLDSNRVVLDSIPLINNEIGQCEHDIATKTKQINDLKNEVKAIESIILLNEEREKNNILLATREKEKNERVKNLTQSIIEKTNEVTDLTYVRKVYETELPNHIMMKACSLLENEMNSFLSKTKNGFLCKLTQNAKGIEFFYKARNEPDWLKAKMASGFEALLLTVAFKISVASAYNTKFIVFDEIDKTATEQSSLKLFETVTSIKGFEQMFVITHKPKSLHYLQEMGAKVYEAINGEFSAY